MTLQNHPGDLEFPVRARWRWVGRVRRLQRSLGSAEARRSQRRDTVVFVIPALVVAIAGTIGQDAWVPVVLPGADHFAVLFLAVLGAMAVGLVAVLVASLPLMRRPLRDQRRWLGLTALEPLTEEQQSLLALDAASDHDGRCWNASLAHEPTWALLPRDLRERHRDGESGQAFVSLPMAPLRLLRERLDQRWRIVSAEDLHLAVADGFAERSTSVRLLRALQDPHATARLAALTGIDEFALRALAEPSGGRPPALAWGADVQRTVLLVRLAHVAGVVGADEAWALIRQAGQVAAAVHDDWPSYDAAVRIGAALDADSLEQVERVRGAAEAVRRGDWPAARAAFPSRASGAVLPVAVLRGGTAG